MLSQSLLWWWPSSCRLNHEQPSHRQASPVSNEKLSTLFIVFDTLCAIGRFWIAMVITPKHQTFISSLKHLQKAPNQTLFKFYYQKILIRCNYYRIEELICHQVLDSSVFIYPYGCHRCSESLHMTSNILLSVLTLSN